MYTGLNHTAFDILLKFLEPVVPGVTLDIVYCVHNPNSMHATIVLAMFTQPQAYKFALHVDPRDQVSLHNLGVVYADVKMWREAEVYLKKVLELYPGEKVATERLAAVRANMKKAGH